MKAYRMAPALDVRSIDPIGRTAVLDSGDTLHITDFLDEADNECDPREAIGAIAEDGESVWWIELTEWEVVH